MKIVTDSIDLINLWARQGHLDSIDIEIMILRVHWDLSDFVSKDLIEHYLKLKIIRFIDTNEIPYSRVFELGMKFKGIHPNNCTLLEFCLANRFILITNDPALLLACTQLKHPSYDSQTFGRQLYHLQRIPIYKNSNDSKTK